MADLATHPVGQPLSGGGASFGTDGIRGRVGTVMTPALALQLGYWVGQVLPGKAPVLLGMDSRTSGPMLMAALESGLTAAGREVWSLGLCPTPAVGRMVSQQRAAGGLMVSASHNPPEDNGIKVFGASGAKLSRTQQESIEAGLRGEVRPALTSCGFTRRREDLLVHVGRRLQRVVVVGGVVDAFVYIAPIAFFHKVRAGFMKAERHCTRAKAHAVEFARPRGRQLQRHFGVERQCGAIHKGGAAVISAWLVVQETEGA